MTDRALVLSLRPRFAQAILDGSKTVELRRRPIKALPGTTVILYESSPTMGVVGTATLTDVVSLRPHTAWRRYRNTLGLTWAEFMEYLTGVEQAHLLRLDDVKELAHPLSLGTLRASASFRPPQSFRYLSTSDPSELHKLIRH
ncbi:ASCH domain-containing protein [Kribbella sp. NBC_01505]|uniref:ASCH domain-containing protein n=1 Tax=Kribbella sp. NBC_01505 TaxID=2903580 RepID=UPI00386B2389